MKLFDVLIKQPMMPLVMDGVESRFSATRLFDQPDPAAFLAREGSRFKAIVTGGSSPTDASLLDLLPNVGLISSFGVGYDGIDVGYASQRGITVTNTPDVLNDEVADTAIGLLISTVRRLPQADRYVREGKWLKANFQLTDTLRGKTMGILGLGRIGKAIARRAEAFGLKLAYHGRNHQPDVSYPYFPSLIEMAKAVDILMIIAPGGPATQAIVNRDVLSALGPRGILINVARGTLVDEPAMVEMLQSGALGAAGLDVFVDEPNVPTALFGLENVVLLPHVGSGSVDTRNRMGQLVIDNVVAYSEGLAPLTPVAETPWKG
ncbi:LdhA Lactate dehydrogenase and related dehydrogenases [Rhabdaerophilaceae bacterium]